MATDRTLIKVTEAQWMAQVIELAELHSWRVMHVRPAIARQSARRVAIETDEGVVIRADLDMSAAMASRIAYTLELEMDR